MPIRDLKAALNKEHSKVNTVKIVEQLIKRPLELKTVFTIIQQNETVLAQRAAWIISTIQDTQPNLLAPFYRDLLSLVDRKYHDAVLRASLRSLSKMNIEEKDQGALFDKILILLQKKQTATAIKAWIIDILMSISGKFPTLQQEIKITLEDQLINATPGLKNKIVKAIQKINNNFKRSLVP